MTIKTTCSVCKIIHDDIRMRIDEGCYGPVDIQTCQECHEKEMAKIRAESKRLHMRLKTQKWEQLTNKGAFCEIR